MRVYLPSTLPALRRLLDERQVTAAARGTVAYAVTSALRDEHGGADLEELEYEALTAAARESVRLLAADEAAPPRRVVLAADVPTDAVTPAPERGRAGVRVAAALPLARVAAVHIDDAEAAAAVRAAADALVGDEGEQDGPGMQAVDDHELLWFATQEIPALLEG